MPAVHDFWGISELEAGAGWKRQDHQQPESMEFQWFTIVVRRAAIFRWPWAHEHQALSDLHWAYWPVEKHGALLCGLAITEPVQWNLCRSEMGKDRDARTGKAALFRDRTGRTRVPAGFTKQKAKTRLQSETLLIDSVLCRWPQSSLHKAFDRTIAHTRHKGSTIAAMPNLGVRPALNRASTPDAAG